MSSGPLNLDTDRFAELRAEGREPAALAPQDRTGRGELSLHSPEWVWVPVDAHETPELWWEGSDYTDPASRPAFRKLPYAVTWGASRYGYCVFAYDEDGAPVHEYQAGNSRLDSGAYVEPGKGSSLPLQTLRRYARQTAGDIAAALGVPAERIGEDKDAAPDFSEAYRHGR